MLVEEESPLLDTENTNLLSNILRISQESNQKAIRVREQLVEGGEHIQKCIDKNQEIDSEVGKSLKILKKIKGLLFVEKMSLWIIIWFLFLVDFFLVYHKF